MNITFVFFLGFFITLIGVIPPGLLNMSAAKISLKEGSNRGFMFSFGVCIVVLLQTYLALTFSKYLQSHPNTTEILQRVAFVIFILITIYFFLLAQKQPKPNIDNKIKSKQSRFFQGMLLSALNVFPIPYQAYMTTTIAGFNWLAFDATSIASYMAGAATGTFVMLYVYMFFFDKIRSKKITTQKNMNYLIGTITAIITILTLVNIVNDL